MTPKNIDTLKTGAKHLETFLVACEGILDASNNRPLYLASRSMEQAFKHLFEMDPSVLSPEITARIQTLIENENPPKGGRNTFNTGF